MLTVILTEHEWHESRKETKKPTLLCVFSLVLQTVFFWKECKRLALRGIGEGGGSGRVRTFLECKISSGLSEFAVKSDNKDKSLWI